MNIFQQYGIKEVADVCFYSIEEDENDDEVYVPVLYLDTLKVSTIEQTSSDTAARGGLGNPKLIVWDFGKEITLTLEDALYSPASMAMVWGSKLKTKPFTLNGYITHYVALDLDELSIRDDYKTIIDNGTLTEDEPPHIKENGSENILDTNGNINNSYDMDGDDLTDARLTITKFGNFEMAPKVYVDDNVSLTAYVWQDCEGYIKSKNNKYQYSFKHCKLCYLCDEEWNTGLRGKWVIHFNDEETTHDGYAESLLHSDIMQFHMTTYDQLTGKPQRIVCNFFPDDLFLDTQYTDEQLEKKYPIDPSTVYSQNRGILTREQQILNQERQEFLQKYRKYGLFGFNKNKVMYTTYHEYKNETFQDMTQIKVSDWEKLAVDRNESVIPPQECIYQIDHAIDNVFYLDRIEKCKATQTFAIDTNLNQLEGNWRYLPAYKQTALTVYIDPKTMQPYEPNTNVFYRRNGDAWYGYDLINTEEDTPTTDLIEDEHYNYRLELKDYQGEDAPYNIKVFKQYEIYYKWTRTRAAENTSLGKQIIVDAAHFPGTYRIVGECYSRSRETGKDERFQFEIPLAKVKANQESITLQADGDPTTFTMEIDVLRPENGEMMKLTQYNVVRSEYSLDLANEPRKKQKSGATEIVSEDLVKPEDPFEDSNLDDDGTADDPEQRNQAWAKPEFNWVESQQSKVSIIPLSTPLTQTINADVSSIQTDATKTGKTTSNISSGYGPWIIDTDREDKMKDIYDGNKYSDRPVSTGQKKKKLGASSNYAPPSVINASSKTDWTDFQKGQILHWSPQMTSDKDYYWYLSNEKSSTPPEDTGEPKIVFSMSNTGNRATKLSIGDQIPVVNLKNQEDFIVPPETRDIHFARPSITYKYPGKKNGYVYGNWDLPQVRYMISNYKGYTITGDKEQYYYDQPEITVSLNSYKLSEAARERYQCTKEGYLDGIHYHVGDLAPGYTEKTAVRKIPGHDDIYFVDEDCYTITQANCVPKTGYTITDTSNPAPEALIETKVFPIDGHTYAVNVRGKHVNRYKCTTTTKGEKTYWTGDPNNTVSQSVYDNYLSNITDYASVPSSVLNKNKCQYEYNKTDAASVLTNDDTFIDTIPNDNMASGDKDKGIGEIYYDGFSSSDVDITSNDALKYGIAEKETDANIIAQLDKMTW